MDYSVGVGGLYCAQGKDHDQYSDDLFGKDGSYINWVVIRNQDYLEVPNFQIGDSLLTGLEKLGFSSMGIEYMLSSIQESKSGHFGVLEDELKSIYDLTVIWNTWQPEVLENTEDQNIGQSVAGEIRIEWIMDDECLCLFRCLFEEDCFTLVQYYYTLR